MFLVYGVSYMIVTRSNLIYIISDVFAQYSAESWTIWWLAYLMHHDIKDSIMIPDVEENFSV